MKRIILSSILIVLTAGTLVFGATKAFFADTETSTANVFTAGAIDLTIDNESYYNGTLNASTTWTQKDLTIEKFFDFPDVKPDDFGEDTISLHVDTNDAYLCANVTLTSNNDNTQTEPEALVDANGTTTGELANLVNFLWWADDGDNVLETNESVISQGNFNQLGIGTTYPLTLADSATNIWTGTPGPVPGNSTRYIGKAWCFGTLGTAPITQDNSGTLMSPADNNDGVNGAGQPEDGGVTCNGNALGNESQTDSLTADVTFEAVQARHNGRFRCAAPEPIVSTVTVVKVVVGGPQAQNPSAFSFVLDAQSPAAFEGDGTNVVSVTAGVHSVVEVPTQDYVSTYSSVNGTNCTNLVVPGNGNVTCTITNTYVPPTPTTITIEKIVSGGTAVAGDFTFTIDGNAAVLGSNGVTPGAHVVSEVAVANYTPAYSGGCDANGNITAVSNTNATCTITNTFVPPTPTTITITKSVVGGTATTGSFTYRIDGNAVPLGSNVVTPGSHTVTETGGPANYVATLGGSCNASGTITAVSNTNVTCAITNTFTPPATTTIVTESFGTGDCLADIPGWDEDPGESCTNGTVAAAIGTGDNTASPDGGRFALIGNNGYICRSINATGLQNLAVSYYWRGDNDADAGENGLVTFATGGTCASPTGTTTLAAHPLTTLTWQSNTVPLPPSLNNTIFFARFFSGTNAGTESFRVDGLVYTGIPI